jgi:hypothetical protein
MQSVLDVSSKFKLSLGQLQSLLHELGNIIFDHAPLGSPMVELARVMGFLVVMMLSFAWLDNN